MKGLLWIVYLLRLAKGLAISSTPVSHGAALTTSRRPQISSLTSAVTLFSETTKITTARVLPTSHEVTVINSASTKKTDVASNNTEKTEGETGSITTTPVSQLLLSKQAGEESVVSSAVSTQSFSLALSSRQGTSISFRTSHKMSGTSRSISSSSSTQVTLSTPDASKPSFSSVLPIVSQVHTTSSLPPDTNTDALSIVSSFSSSHTTPDTVSKISTAPPATDTDTWPLGATTSNGIADSLMDVRRTSSSNSHFSFPAALHTTSEVLLGADKDVSEATTNFTAIATTTVGYTTLKAATASGSTNEQSASVEKQLQTGTTVEMEYDNTWNFQSEVKMLPLVIAVAVPSCVVLFVIISLSFLCVRWYCWQRPVIVDFLPFYKYKGPVILPGDLVYETSPRKPQRPIVLPSDDVLHV